MEAQERERGRELELWHLLVHEARGNVFLAFAIRKRVSEPVAQATLPSSQFPRWPYTSTFPLKPLPPPCHRSIVAASCQRVAQLQRLLQSPPPPPAPHHTAAALPLLETSADPSFAKPVSQTATLRNQRQLKEPCPCFAAILPGAFSRPCEIALSRRPPHPRATALLLLRSTPPSRARRNGRWLR
jgi:hypothetical protein